MERLVVLIRLWQVTCIHMQSGLGLVGIATATSIYWRR